MGPQELLISLGSRCQYKCRFCVYLTKKHGDDLAFPVWADVLRRAYKAGTRSLEIGGQGEPTLSTDFLKIIQLARKLGFKIRLLTNAQDREVLANALPALEALTVNMNALTPAAFTAVHGVPSKTALPRAIKNIIWAAQAIREQALATDLRVSYVIDKLSWKGALDFPTRLAALLKAQDKAMSPVFVNFHHMLVVPGNYDLCPGPADLTRLLKAFIKAKDDPFLKAHTNSAGFIRHTQKVLAFQRVIGPFSSDTPPGTRRARTARLLGSRSSCDACCKVIFVDCNGDVFGCYNPTRMVYGLAPEKDTLFYGNVHRVPFRRMLAHARTARPLQVDLNDRYWKVCVICGLKSS